MLGGKVISRNSFSEKIVQRYFLETMYFSPEIAEKRGLLPNINGESSTSRLLPGDIRLIVPEDGSKPAYRPDFSIYFARKKLPVPVEIKWKKEDLSGASAK